ncbi:MAG: hypothetical protein FWF33_07155 [Clostridiales bacterium]|nr:hypothetical protein [Clostridiales bacterium]
MEIIISHKSALEYWRLYRSAKIKKAAKLRNKKNLPAGFPNIAGICGVLPSGLSFPVNLMISNKNGKRRSRVVRPRVYTGAVPEWSFIRISDGVAVSAPAFCFFQMAGELPLVRLVELGLELCGTYSLPASDRPQNDTHRSASHSGRGSVPDLEHIDTYINDYGNVRGMERVNESGKAPETAEETSYNLSPLTSAKELRSFAARMQGVKGYEKALRALRYVADGSASPMETILFMLLTLPYKYGGYGLPAPELNKRINIGKAAKQRPGRAFYKCDFFWPAANLAVEYDSSLYHTDAGNIANDSRKRLDLDTLGIDVITATGEQVRNVYGLESLAKRIAHKLGKQLRYKNPGFDKVQRGLHELLL